MKRKGCAKVGCVLILFSRCKKHYTLSHIIQNLTRLKCNRFQLRKKFMSEFTNSNLLPIYNHSTTIITYTFIILLLNTFEVTSVVRNFRHTQTENIIVKNKVPFICITVQQVVNLFKFEF